MNQPCMQPCISYHCSRHHLSHPPSPSHPPNPFPQPLSAQDPHLQRHHIDLHLRRWEPALRNLVASGPQHFDAGLALARRQGLLRMLLDLVKGDGVQRSATLTAYGQVCAFISGGGGEERSAGWGATGSQPVSPAADSPLPPRRCCTRHGGMRTRQWPSWQLAGS